MPAPFLPDRVTVPTCIACGAMGRDARCETDCSEHRLRLVGAADFDALCEAGELARSDLSVLGPLLESLSRPPPPDSECDRVYGELRDAARRLLPALSARGGDRESPSPVVGWWCAECGNVDAPQPCLGVCVWRRMDWVNADLYDEELICSALELDAARVAREVLGLLLSVQPKPGGCAEAWRAMQRRGGLG